MAAAAIHYTSRQLSMLPGSPLDRRIALLKRALPVSAAALFVIVLAMTFSQTNELSFMVSRDKVQPANERIRAEDSVYRGVDQSGRPFSVRAGSAIQRSAAVAEVELTGISATMALPNGPAVIAAPSGRLELGSSLLTVAGPVNAKQAGFTIGSGAVTIDLTRGTAASNLPVAGRIPIGAFRAGGLTADIGAESVTLTGGVALRIPRAMGS